MKKIKKFLFTNDTNPEILIRTGNTNRLSNFLLWQSAYSEIFFEKKLWQNSLQKIIKRLLINIKKLKEILEEFNVN